MVINPSQLLKRLEPSVRSTDLAARNTVPPGPFEAQGFDQLLALVSRGKIGSRPVEIGLDLEGELDEQQQRRLAAAADLAEASGARNALMLLDGRGLLLDVGARTVTAELSATGASPIVAIDAAVYVAGDEALGRGRPLTPGRGLPGLPGAGLLPPAIARRFEELDAGLSAVQVGAANVRGFRPPALPPSLQGKGSGGGSSAHYQNAPHPHPSPPP